MSPLSGNAGFRYTPTGGTEKTHALAFPMKLQIAPGHRQNRWTVDSLDLSAHEVISIASGRMEVSAMLRFNRKSQDLIDMLRHAANGVVLTYYPDLSINTGYDLWLIDGSDLVELAWDQARYGLGEYQVPVRFRDASASGTSLEALFSPWLFRYDAGMARDDITFTRTGTARQIGQFGVPESVATGLPRDGHWLLVDGVRTPSLLLEGARTNLVTSDDVSAWTDQSTTTVTGSIADPAGGTGAYTITGDGGATSEARYRTVSFTGDAQKAAVFVVKEDTMPASGNQGLAIYDNTAPAFRLELVISGWVDGEPTVSGSVGTYLGKQYIGNGFWAIYGRTTTVTAANTHRLYVYSNVSASAGAITLYRANAFDALDPPSMPLDASGVLGAEAWYSDIGFAPQALTFYLKFRELMTPVTNWAAEARLLHAGNAAETGARAFLYRPSGSLGVYTMRHVNGSGVDTSVNLSPGWGDIIELAGRLYADGSVDIVGSKNGAAAVSSSASSTETLASSWGGSRLYLNSVGASHPGLADFLSVKVAAGTKTLAEMRAL